MRPEEKDLEKVGTDVASTMSKWAIPLLRWSLGITYIWFGALKVAGVSPVAEMVEKSAFILPRKLFGRVLGVWEMAVGIALLFRIALPVTLALYFAQIAGTFMVFVRRPRDTFQKGNPLRLTFSGEFILKNLVLIAAGIAVGSTADRDKEEVGVTPEEVLRKPEKLGV